MSTATHDTLPIGGEVCAPSARGYGKQYTALPGSEAPGAGDRAQQAARMHGTAAARIDATSQRATSQRDERRAKRAERKAGRGAA